MVKIEKASMKLSMKKKIMIFIGVSSSIIATIWFSLLNFTNWFHDAFYVSIDNDTEIFTTIGIVITTIVILYVIAAGIVSIKYQFEEVLEVEEQEEVIENLYDAIEQTAFERDALDNKLTLTKNLLSSVGSITDRNVREFYDSFHTPASFEFNIDKELCSVVEEMINYFSDMTKIDRQLIGASLLYRIKLINGEFTPWRMYPAINVDNTMSKTELLSNDFTTASIVRKTKRNVFHADKKIAIENYEYVADPKDRDFNNIGSIICRNVSIKDSDNNHNCVEAILTITSHGEQIIQENDRDARQFILTRVLHFYEMQVKEVLAKIFLINRNKFKYEDNTIKFMQCLEDEEPDIKK